MKEILKEIQDGTFAKEFVKTLEIFQLKEKPNVNIK